MHTRVQAMTNTSPFVAPTRAMPGAYQGGGGTALGTNALAAGAATASDSFELDMATSAVAVGKIEVMHRKGAEVPHGWGIDKSGVPTSDPSKILPNEGGALMPLGGGEDTAGYKGMGMGMLLEILCGVLPAAATGPDVAPWVADRTDPINYGHCFVCIDPVRLDIGTNSQGDPATFEQRLQRYLDQMRGLPAVEDALRVIVPGDPEKEAAAAVAAGGGVQLGLPIAASLKALGTRLGVELPASILAVEQSAPKHYAS